MYIRCSKFKNIEFPFNDHHIFGELEIHLNTNQTSPNITQKNIFDDLIIPYYPNYSNVYFNHKKCYIFPYYNKNTKI